MGQAISFFSDYTGGENKVTNYCGLMLKMLYLESPTKFEEYIVGILGESDGLAVGPLFEQQVKSNKSVPDLIINQNSFAIHFETKLSDWFYSEQIKRHIDGFDEKFSKKILILLGDVEIPDVEKRVAEEIKYGKNKNVTVIVMTFETLLDSLFIMDVSDSLTRMFEEFREFLDRNKLLPTWKSLLDIVNCVGSMDEIEKGYYICPNTGGAYSQRRARFFGPYKNKNVSQVREIKAVVEVALNMETTTIRWNNSEIENDIYKQEVKIILENHSEKRKENINTPLQFFILGTPYPTNYSKISSGGMQGSKRYLYLDEKYDDAKQLAKFLEGKTWE